MEDKNFEQNNFDFDTSADDTIVSEPDLGLEFEDFGAADEFGFGSEQTTESDASAAFATDTLGFASGFPQWDLLPPER